MRILEGRRRQVEERREGLRTSMGRASEQIDRYTHQLHRLGLETSEREVRWLNELISAEGTSNAEGTAPESAETSAGPPAAEGSTTTDTPTNRGEADHG